MRKNSGRDRYTGRLFGVPGRHVLPGLAVALRLAAAAQTTNLEPGQEVFQKHCAPCHGPRGEGGKGPTLAQAVLPRAPDEASLRQVIGGGIPGTEMPPAHLQGDEFSQVVAFVKSLGTRPVEKTPGDPQHGAEVYATKGGCVKCHTLHGEGGLVGPDLSDVGRRRSAAYLGRKLVEPSADVPQSFNPFRAEVNLPENFLLVRLKTREGEEIAGVRVNEDTFSIQIRDVDGRMHSFYKADMTEVSKEWGKSPMASYAGTLSTNELDDVVAFLVSLREGK